jgi:hypothetical protein
MTICLGELLHGSSLTLLTVVSSCAGSPALCLDRPIVGKAQRDGDQVYTHNCSDLFVFFYFSSYFTAQKINYINAMKSINQSIE